MARKPALGRDERVGKSARMGERSKNRTQEKQDPVDALRAEFDELIRVDLPKVEAELGSAPRTTGNLQEFPRPTKDVRAARQGLAVLRRSAEELSAVLDLGAQIGPERMTKLLAPFASAFTFLASILPPPGEHPEKGEAADGGLI